jgi:hypothetical protein
MDRTPLIMAVFMVVKVSSAARGEEPSGTVDPADASSIILAPRSLSSDHTLTPDPVSGGWPASLPGATETLTGMTAYGPGSTSSNISAMIAAGLAKYDPSPKAIKTATAGTSPKEKAIQATTGIISLPAFVVRDAKVPNEDQILTAQGRAKIAMDKYLGPSGGLDRGLLNRFTLKQLWMKIPILRAFPIEFVGTPVRMSNEDRAFDAGGANDTIPYPHPPPKVKDGSDQ